MKRRGEINLFEMLKDPSPRKSSEERSATEEHLYGERRFGGARKPEPTDPTEELFRKFSRQRTETDAPASEPAPTTPAAEPATDSAPDRDPELATTLDPDSEDAEGLEAPAPPPAVGAWTTWGNHMLKIRRVTFAVLIVGWGLTMFVAFAAGRAGGRPVRSDIVELTSWTNSPSWAPVAIPYAKDPIRTVKSGGASLAEGGDATKPKVDNPPTPVAPLGGTTSSGLPMPQPGGKYVIRVSETGGNAAGVAYERLLKHLDEFVTGLGAPASAV
ncbi:MAG: hypothetical protein AAF488_15590, partial [Planctomycetota bacterium]